MGAKGEDRAKDMRIAWNAQVPYRPEPAKQSRDTPTGTQERPGEPSPRKRSTATGSRNTPTMQSGRPGEALEQHVKYLRRELKVCEGCGGLWVRTGAEAGVYCRTCSALVADLPGRRRRSPGRPCKVHGAGETRLQVVMAAATGEQLRKPRGRCVRGAEADEQRMERMAVERRAGMALVRATSPEGAREVVDADAVAATTMPMPVVHAESAEPFVATAMVGGAR